MPTPAVNDPAAGPAVLDAPLPAEVDGDPAGLSPAKIRDRGLRQLPRTLGEASDCPRRVYRLDER